MSRLGGRIPRDPRLSQFVRAGTHKLVYRADGSAMVFDLAEPMGISEQTDRARERSKLIAAVRQRIPHGRAVPRKLDLTAALPKGLINAPRR